MSTFSHSFLHRLRNFARRKVTWFGSVSLCPGAHLGKWKLLTKNKFNYKYAFLLIHTNKSTKIIQPDQQSQEEYFCLTSSLSHNAREFPGSVSELAPSWPASLSAQMPAQPQRNIHPCKFVRMAQKRDTMKHSKMEHLGAFSDRMSTPKLIPHQMTYLVHLALTFLNTNTVTKFCFLYCQVHKNVVCLEDPFRGT